MTIDESVISKGGRKKPPFFFSYSKSPDSTTRYLTKRSKGKLIPLVHCLNGYTHVQMTPSRERKDCFSLSEKNGLLRLRYGPSYPRYNSGLHTFSVRFYSCNFVPLCSSDLVLTTLYARSGPDGQKSKGHYTLIFYRIL